MGIVYHRTGLTGGTSDDLDGISGSVLADKDLAFCNVSGTSYIYRLDASSGASESSPDVIAPDTDPGDKRWLLQQAYNTGFPGGHIGGLAASNGTDSDHDLDIATGECRNDGNDTDMILSGALTKQIDAAWAAGTDQGGLDTGTVAANTTYHVFLIKNTSSQAVDVLISESLSSPTMPSGYTKKRRVFSIFTDSSSNVTQFDTAGNIVLIKDPPLDINVSDQGTTAVSRTLSIPGGKSWQIFLNVYTENAGTMRLYISSPLANDEVPSATAAPLGQFQAASAGTLGTVSVLSGTTSQIRTRASLASTTLRIVTLGWRDMRGAGE